MIRTYTKTIAGEYTELDTDFMKALIKEKEIQFFHADLTIDGKEYKVVNIPVVILNDYDEWHLYKYLKKYGYLSNNKLLLNSFVTLISSVSSCFILS